ncbi:MAG TPA: L-histidine N(alpha)-methyltransferase [Myxococcales bacterium]|nr:L-histidine N(alpha)-methyltransferase [Myxococcales bacterium]
MAMERFAVGPRCMRCTVPEPDRFLEDVLAGLRGEQKTLPCKYLYDARGSLLFEEICELDEYYPTRTEFDIMESSVADMAGHLGESVLLIEYGSGSSRKTRLLLDAMRAPAGYVPIDISGEILEESASAIVQRYPGLEVFPICADYLMPLQIPKLAKSVSRSVVYFPGSTIGNFRPEEALEFLNRVAHLIGEGGGLLIGVDLRKEPDVLRRAYDDSNGVTAAFNRNLLTRINRELAGEFPEEAFRHESFWNKDHGRIEMHLVCETACRVAVGAEFISFSAGESIVTEYAYKYEVGEFQSLASKAGFTPQAVWTDPEEKFSVHYFNVRQSHL